ncbi:MAG: hypothetical protein J5769_01465 [Bacteroidales bacterium]|nr:hypothetical protein [Bacteroidales bacterium]
MKKTVSIIFLCLAALWSMSAQSKFSYSLELKAGAGLGHGPIALFTPEFVAQYDLGGGFIAGAGAGARLAMPCLSYNVTNGKYTGRSFVEEIDIPLFLRVGYGLEKFYVNLDSGFAIGIGSVALFAKGGGPMEARYDGLFFEPHVGWRINERRTLALGFLFQQSTVADRNVTYNDSSMKEEYRTRNMITPAITLRYGIMF